jgi:prepilin-type N-terminal cleavage/methylation domain-containing protein
MKRLRASESGFTLIELIMAIVIMGILTVPLANFVLAYFDNYQTTQNRLSDSHDIQIATAYFSQDVANTSTVTTISASFPATYCGHAWPGTPVVLFQWQAWSVTSGAGGLPTGASSSISAVYVKEGSTLHRLYCGGPGSSDVTVVHNLLSASPQCFTVAGVSATCDGATAPPKVRLTLSISSGSTDSAAPEQPVTLDGQRRQT